MTEILPYLLLLATRSFLAISKAVTALPAPIERWAGFHESFVCPKIKAVRGSDSLILILAFQPHNPSVFRSLTVFQASGETRRDRGALLQL